MSSLRNPKDSMKSTWRSAEKSTWGFFHWVYEVLKIHPSSLDKQAPKHPKTDKIPYVPDWQMHAWVLGHSLVPLALQQLYVRVTGQNLSPWAAFAFYTFAYKASAINQLHSVRRLGEHYGFLDGDKHDRDEVPDIGVSKVIFSLMSTSTFRTAMSVYLSYRRTQTPAQASWLMLPIEIGLYGIVLDFWFYWYHRIMHEFDSLWQFHRTHHLTKHPNPLLTLYADHEQEFFDIAGIPLMTWLTLKFMGFPMGFFEWWICQQYVTFSELSGHSGLRLCAAPPNTFTWLLRYFDCELVIEDHDLHHRSGWKKSHNYGKQTRLWDRVFGTCHDRIETSKDNIDYDNPAWIFI